MLSTIRKKLRALVADFTKSDFETFTYLTSSVFTISESNIINITVVLINGVALGSGDFNFDTITNKITISASLSSDDQIEVDYTYQKYSDSELTEYIRGAIVWISVFSYEEEDFEIENDNVYPTPNNKTQDLIALIGAILIKPNYTEYHLPNLTVKYPRKFSKEEKISKLISQFDYPIGEMNTLEFN